MASSRQSSKARSLRKPPQARWRAYSLELSLVALLLLGYSAILAKRIARSTDFLEAEDLTFVDKTPGTKVFLQRMPARNGRNWSNGWQLVSVFQRVGDVLQFELPVKSPGRYRVSVQLTKSFDCPWVEVLAGGQKLGEVDLYSPEVRPTGLLDLGVVELSPVHKLLAIRVSRQSTSSRAPHFIVGIDGVLLRREP